MIMIKFKILLTSSMVAHQASGAEVLSSNPASPTVILMRCRIIV